ncbi:MAG: helix-turn-helix domain-containing protein [Fusobacteriaceae bacterium]
MSLRKKELDVLFLLNKEEVTINEISRKIETSERNIRYIIDNLNFYLKKIINKKIKRIEKNFTINLKIEEVDIFLKKIYKNDYILDQNERIEYILLIFLFLKDVNLIFIEKMLKITRATLKKDMDLLNLNLKEYSLQLEFFKNKYTLVGNEKKLRHLKMLKIIRLINDNSHKTAWLDKELLLREFNVKKRDEIKIDIDSIEKEFSVYFNEEFKELIYIFIIVTLERINMGKIINRKENYEYLITTTYHKIIIKKLKKYIPLNLKYELGHLTEYFISGGANKNIKELKISVELYVEGLISILKEKKYILDYFRLKEKITIYLIPAIYRLKNNFSIGKTGEKEKIYELVNQYSVQESFLPEKLGENEIYYITQAILIEISKEKNKVISLKRLLEIIEKNSTGINRENIINELLLEYSEVLKKDFP